MNLDIYGIGPAVTSAVEIYFSASRRTGRTALLIEQIKNGDLVLFATPTEAARIQRECHSRGIKASCVVLSGRDPHEAFYEAMRRAPQRVLLDHGWVEEWYRQALRSARDELMSMSKEAQRLAGGVRHEPLGAVAYRELFETRDSDGQGT